MFTLYFSGTAPGHFTTKLTKLPVDGRGEPILSRGKRDANDAMHIQPSGVLKIENTLPPTFLNEIESAAEKQHGFLDEIYSTSDLDSSMSVVTVTKTVTQTVACTL